MVYIFDHTVCESFSESKEESADDSECEFLRENSNALEILDIGVVEYVLDHLDPGSTACTGSQPFRQALEALLHVAKDDNRKREVFSRGAVTNAINLHDMWCFISLDA